VTLLCSKHTSGLAKKNIFSLSYRYGLDSLGIEPRLERDFLHPSRPALVPTQSPYAMDTMSFLGVMRPGRGIKHPPHLAKGGVELYLYPIPPPVPSWQVIG
jgi:hypothetical protein